MEQDEPETVTIRLVSKTQLRVEYPLSLISRVQLLVEDYQWIPPATTVGSPCEENGNDDDDDDDDDGTSEEYSENGPFGVDGNILDINKYNDIWSTLESAGISIDKTSIPRQVVAAFVEDQRTMKPVRNRRHDDDDDDADVDNVKPYPPKEFFKGLSCYPHQEKGIRFGVAHNGRCLIADAMGLGKTMQALGIAACFRQDWPLIIVCPMSTMVPWSKEIARRFSYCISPEEILICSAKKSLNFIRNRQHTKSLNLNTRAVKKSKKKNMKQQQKIAHISVYIMTYDRLREDLKSVLELDCNMVIFDESHLMKNSGAKKTIAALALASHCERVVLLSGTPVLSKAIELYTQTQAICPKLFVNEQEFAWCYCNPRVQKIYGRKGVVKYITNFLGSSNLSELKLVLSMFMIRQDKRNITLPPKTRLHVKLQLQMTPDEEEMMEEYRTQCRFRNNKPSSFSPTDPILRWFQETARVKTSAICRYIKERLRMEGKDRKIIIFAHHTPVMEGICETLTNIGTSFMCIRGDTTLSQRAKLCSLFMNNNLDTNVANGNQHSPQVAVLSILAAGTGLTLTSSSLVIFGELYWHPGSLHQAEDRVHRIGQTADKVTIEYLVAPGTADDLVWPMLLHKCRVVGSLGLGTEDGMNIEEVGGGGGGGDGGGEEERKD